MGLFGTPGRGDQLARRVIIPLVILLAIVVVPVWIVHFPLKVGGDSMVPTLLPDDRILVTRGRPAPIPGDVVVARLSPRPGWPESDQVKRVIAVAGQTVSVQRGRALVDGSFEQLDRSIILDEGDVSAEEILVPDGHVYLLGDNRPASLDSRFFGPVPLAAIRGRVTFVFAPITRFGRVD